MTMYLSDVFKHISHYRHAGHQIGRKIGDMLEILTYSAIARDPELAKRLHIEPKLIGASGAGHKVEFTILKDPPKKPIDNICAKKGGEIDDLATMIGFIECKRVGVEQTINQTFKRNFPRRRVDYGSTIPIGFNIRGGQNHRFNVKIDKKQKIIITKDGDSHFQKIEDLVDGCRIIFALSPNGDATVLMNDQSLRDYHPKLQRCRILDFSTIHADCVEAVLNDCLHGPQTPEKAKQASFVALDTRKKRFGSFDPRTNESEMLSILVVGEPTHWEDKSRNMIRYCIDQNVTVSDKIIVQAFQAMEDFYTEDFYDYIAKDKYENDSVLRGIIDKLVNGWDGKIFRRLDDDGSTYRLKYCAGKLILE